MLYESACIGTRSTVDADTCAVRPTMLLGEVVRRFDLDTTAYLLLEDDEGRLLGIIESEEILRRVRARHVVERERWLSMTVSAALQGCFEFGAPRPGRTAEEAGHETGEEAPDPPRREIPCTVVEGADGMAAIHTGGDLFVSWRRFREALREAMVDAVTSLPNRSVFDRRVREEFDRAARLHHSLAVILIDVDHFKSINDRHGHAVGDAVLRRLGTVLQEQIRSYDLLARYGGDEFAVLCSGCQPGEIDIPVRRLAASLRAARWPACLGADVPTLSIGAAVAHDVEAVAGASVLVEAADICLYRSKAGGRNAAHRAEFHGPVEGVEPVRIPIGEEVSVEC